ncbi:hypothetical protein [Urbifossiella limnaea]|uniref:Uncharacterized protein n=1 Tax=Urbifossiella limnaea TaxID=2528023 RepID=A0A517Y0R4_9BACT|nr:hypothetical protein [Urbifossiella limnaea]QDU23298.1 hypothetical protein ETAA1_52930 [Urbifossiella limnaea]
MFKIGTAPTHTEDAIHHADYIELECLKKSNGSFSGGDLAAVFSRLNDDLPEDRRDADLDTENAIREAFAELGDRIEHSGRRGHRYPYKLNRNADVLTFDTNIKAFDLYLFLLTATRLNMGEDRVHEGIDGAELFEQVCCEVAKNYWGKDAEALVFGTARRVDGREVAGFEAAVDHLCKSMKESDGFCNNYNDAITAQDGKLDVVVWKPFTDQRRGQLIGFGQCKTGTHWSAGLFTLQPDGFCKKWVWPAPVVDPVRLYFITARVKQSKWNEVNVDAGIFFDRCRIMDYAPPMPTLRQQWIKWTRAALLSHGITMP